MVDLSEELNSFFERISEKRFSEARLVADAPSLWGVGRLGQGRKGALHGIISLFNSKSDAIGNLKTLNRMLEIFSRRINSIWCDDFDKGYFEVWIKFIEFSKRQDSGVIEKLHEKSM